MPTIHEAREMWCPFARAVDQRAEPSAAINRQDGGHPDVDTLCLGSRCMAWRWSEPGHGADPDRNGYCGLAGMQPAFLFAPEE